jgi:enoyl-[acyl-carrier-protein] reductase (NADH)
MMDPAKFKLLKGKKALVTGIANDQSIAWGCAKAFDGLRAELAITYRDEKTKKVGRSPHERREALDLHAHERGKYGRTGSGFRGD